MSGLTLLLPDFGIVLHRRIMPRSDLMARCGRCGRTHWNRLMSAPMSFRVLAFRWAAITALLLAQLGAASAACSGCGCRGGPGYRGPDGKCVGWAELARRCGSPPTQRCTPEQVNSPPSGDATKETRQLNSQAEPL